MVFAFYNLKVRIWPVKFGVKNIWLLIDINRNSTCWPEKNFAFRSTFDKQISFFLQINKIKCFGNDAINSELN